MAPDATTLHSPGPAGPRSIPPPAMGVARRRLTSRWGQRVTPPREETKVDGVPVQPELIPDTPMTGWVDARRLTAAAAAAAALARPTTRWGPRRTAAAAVPDTPTDGWVLADRAPPQHDAQTAKRTAAYNAHPGAPMNLPVHEQAAGNGYTWAAVPLTVAPPEPSSKTVAPKGSPVAPAALTQPVPPSQVTWRDLAAIFTRQSSGVLRAVDLSTARGATAESIDTGADDPPQQLQLAPTTAIEEPMHVDSVGSETSTSVPAAMSEALGARSAHRSWQHEPGQDGGLRCSHPRDSSGAWRMAVAV